MSNKTELLLKIKALARLGVDGEQENAVALLSRLMLKYGISESELDDERRTLCWFRYSQKIECKLLNQIIYMVTAKPAYGCKGIRKKKELGTECTVVEQLEIEANYDFFKNAMEKELAVFHTAFYTKNQLYPDYEKLKDREQKELTPEDVERHMKAGLMAAGMDKHSMLKQIGGK